MALFDRSYVEGYQGIGQEKTPLDHLAFTIDREDFYTEKARLERSGIMVIEKSRADFPGVRSYPSIQQFL